jgi:predicted lipoprotein with Yx(FWY)xxD motif
MSHSLSGLFALPLAALVLAACSTSSDGATTAAPAVATDVPYKAVADSPPSSSDAAGTIVVANGAASIALADASIALADTALGSVLVDRDGNTLYLFTKDAAGAPACNADCLANWPPLLADAAATPGDGLSAADFATIAAADGSQQVTFHGHPLYTYAGDQTAGDTNGQGVGGAWFVVDAQGNAVR